MCSHSRYLMQLSQNSPKCNYIWIMVTPINIYELFCEAINYIPMWKYSDWAWLVLGAI